MKKLYLIPMLVLTLMSCSKDQLSTTDLSNVENSTLETRSGLTTEQQDSMLQYYVSLEDIAYSIDITCEEAQAKGISEDVYNDVLTKLTNLNKHTAERRDSGDVIYCAPPIKDIVKTRTVHYPEGLHQMIYTCIGSVPYDFFDAPYIARAIMSSSSFYTSMTLNFVGINQKSYTLTGFNDSDQTAIQITNPDPAAYPLPDGEELNIDLYYTHAWEISVDCYNGSGGLAPDPSMTIYRLR